MGLHLGWIPNEPGLRPRDFERPAPAEPAPDPAKVAALPAAQHARGLWTRLLIAVGLFAFVLFGLVSAVAHITWGWGVAAGLALCCWLPVVLLGLNRRRAAARLRVETERQARQHAAELAEYEQGKAQWARVRGGADRDRAALAAGGRARGHHPARRLRRDRARAAEHGDRARLGAARAAGGDRPRPVAGPGGRRPARRGRAGRASPSRTTSCPADLAETPLLAGLTGEQIASLIVEVVHADDASATAAGRATDLMILKKIIGVLGADVSMGRLHAALTALLGDAPRRAARHRAGTAARRRGPLTEGERASLGALFGDGFRQQVAGNLVRLAAVVEPLTALGTDTPPRPPARLTCLSLADGPRDVAADLTAALVVQWVTRAISERQARTTARGPRSSWRARTSSRPGTWDGSPRCASGTTSPWSGPSPG